MSSVIAVIREQDCIGCAKCIDACPVDAILGSARHTHTVISHECISCKLCIPPCPVDCIDLVPREATDRLPAAHVKMRYRARQARLNSSALEVQEAVIDKKRYVQNAIERIKQVRRALQK